MRPGRRRRTGPPVLSAGRPALRGGIRGDGGRPVDSSPAQALCANPCRRGRRVDLHAACVQRACECAEPRAVRAGIARGTWSLAGAARPGKAAISGREQQCRQGAAAIELRAIDPAEAASYLERVQLDPPPEGWRDLIERIRSGPDSPLSRALDSPLTLTLVRDTYQSGDDARELLDFCDTTQQDASADQAAEDITGHLLDRVLAAAYAHRPASRHHAMTC